MKNGRLRHLSYHQHRFNAARRTLWGLPETDLAARIATPEGLGPGLYKCRVVYGPDVESVAFEPYAPRAIRSLRLVEGGRIDYCFKYADRRALQALFDQRAGCDDVLIVQEGRLTDTSYSNIALYDGIRWVTPAYPLLAGTARARLLEAGVLEEREVPVTELERYQSVRLINAMLDWEGQAPIPVSQVLGQARLAGGE